MELYITKICSDCRGDGSYEKPGPEGDIIFDPCPLCEGKGKRIIRYISLPSNIFYSHEIIEEIDVAEYAALTSTQKEGVQALLACGMVDLNIGKAGRVRLWNWFGSGSTTVTNLTALLE